MLVPLTIIALVVFAAIWAFIFAMLALLDSLADDR